MSGLTSPSTLHNSPDARSNCRLKTVPTIGTTSGLIGTTYSSDDANAGTVKETADDARRGGDMLQGGLPGTAVRTVRPFGTWASRRSLEIRFHLIVTREPVLRH